MRTEQPDQLVSLSLCFFHLLFFFFVSTRLSGSVAWALSRGGFDLHSVSIPQTTNAHHLFKGGFQLTRWLFGVWFRHPFVLWLLRLVAIVTFFLFTKFTCTSTVVAGAARGLSVCVATVAVRHWLTFCTAFYVTLSASPTEAERS